MSEEIDKVAESLSTVRAGGSLDELRVADVEEDDHEVTLVLELPSGDRVTEALSKPPVWGTNCELKTLLDAHDLGPGEVGELVGTELPCEREVTGSGITFEVDLAALDDRR